VNVQVDRMKYMDDSEVTTLRRVCRQWAEDDMADDRRQGVVSWMVLDLALQTGLRVSEIAALQIENCKFGIGNGGLLRVFRLKKNKRKKKRFGLRFNHKKTTQVKMQKKLESLPIGPELAEHLRHFIEWKEVMGQDVSPKAKLFVGKRGPLTARGLQAIFKVVAKKAGLRDELSIHSCRHTVAVRLLKNTGNLRKVQLQLGHANPGTTGNMYGHVSFEDRQDAVTGLYDD